MAQVRKVNSDSKPAARRRPPRTVEEQEHLLVGLAVDQAERQLREGTAPAQLVVALLKHSSPRERLEREKLERENLLLKARVDTLESGRRIEDLYEDAIKAMRAYSGQDPVYDTDAY